MSTTDDVIAGFTARQHGLVALWQTRGVGVADHVVYARRDAGALVRIHDGVYRLRGVPFTQELRWLAGVLAAGPESWLGFRAAAHLHGFGVRRPRPEVVLAHGRECDLNGIDVHRTRRKQDVTVLRGIPVATKPRTILDCASVMPFAAFETMVQDAVAGGLVKVESLYAILDRRGGRGVTGVVATRTALSGDLVDEKIQRKLELILARIITSAAVPKPARQHELVCSDGRVVYLDNAWPDRKLAAEAVGMRWHGNAARAKRDRARRRSIVSTGWTHVDYGWSEATESPAVVRAEIEQLWAGTRAPGVRVPAQNDDRAA